MAPRKRPQSQSSLIVMPVDAVEELPLTRIERNLPTFGYFGAHKPNSKPTRREIPVGMTDGDRKISSVILEAPERLGLPSSVDLKKWNVFSDLFYELRTIHGIVKNPIRFSANDFAQRLGRARGGDTYEEINEWGERLNATTIYSRGVIWHKGSRKFIDTNDRVFRKFTRIKPDKDGGQSGVMFEAVLEDWILDNMNLMYVFRKDAKVQAKLKAGMAVVLFDHLHTWFYASKGMPIERSYSWICQKLNIVERKFSKQIHRQMSPAFDELASEAYLASWKMMETARGDGYKFQLVPGKELLRVLKLSQKKLTDPSDPAAATIDDTPIVAELLSIGVARQTAIELSSLGSEEELLDKLDYINSIIARKGQDFYNPAGFVITKLREGIAVPADFVTSRKRKEIVESNRLDRERQQQEFLNTQAYEQWREERVQEAMKRLFKPAELESEIQSRMPKLLEAYPTLKRARPEARVQSALRLIEKEVRDNLDLPTEDQWLEMDSFKDFQVALPFGSN